MMIKNCGIKKGRKDPEILKSGMGFLKGPVLFLLSVLGISICFWPQPILADTEVSGIITDDTTWTLAGSPYIVISSVAVYKDSTTTATLTIEAGVEVRFNDYTELSIGVNSLKGALIAQGTTEDPILFTSNAVTPALGDWQGICFEAPTDETLTILEHCIIEYGGHSNQSNIRINNASPTIKNSTLRYSSLYGIRVTGENSAPVIGGGAGAGNLITENNSYGVYFAGANTLATVTHNEITDNGSYPIRVTPVMCNLTHNICTGNSQDGIEVIGGNINKDVFWLANNTPYIVTGSITVYKDATTPAALTIEAGSEVKFSNYTELSIGINNLKGALIAQGTVDDPILFTSNAETPAPGDWQGICFEAPTDETLTILEHCIIEYSGYLNGSNIRLNNASPIIKNSTLRYSSLYGIRVTGENSAPVIGGEAGAGNLITDNNTYGVYFDGANTLATVTHNEITDNGSFPIRVLPLMCNVTNNICTGNSQDGIEVIGGNITKDVLWRTNDLPYVVTGSVAVYKDATTPAILTIQPGVEIRFKKYMELTISYSTIKGALIAQGTVDEPILFTSNAETPAPGDWQGICFENGTADTLTIIEHCIVEYGGYLNYSNIRLNNASPTIQYNTLRNSSNRGIYINGTGCDTAAINCNNLKDNHYGIYLISNAQPSLFNNNFLNNQDYGIYNGSTGVTIIAEDNWWGDAGGPNLTGDQIYGNVDYDPWLTAESGCVNAPPTNSPPFTPSNPTPAHQAVRIPVLDEGLPIDVAVSWTGGDPNPWDTVVYDIYSGTESTVLSLLATDLADPNHTLSGLAEGATYYWQVVARDNNTGETTGPIWQFTTLGDAPDLIISQIDIDPAGDIGGGDTVAFTATVLNNGDGPCVDSFSVDFQMNGSLLGTKGVTQIIPVGNTVLVSQTWTAGLGDHTLEVTADVGDTVVEIYDDNNSLAVAVPTVTDKTAPELMGTVPGDGAVLQQVDEITMTLFDEYGTIDVTGVSGSIEVRNHNNDLIDGSVTEAADVFTFTPAGQPLADGTYTVTLTAVDLAGNSQALAFGFTTDSQPPSGLIITGGTVYSGLIQARPIQNQSNTTSITLTGTREDDTEVWINGLERVALGSGNWSVNLSLSQGDNSLEVLLQDRAGNSGPSEWVDISVDSLAPTVVTITPAHNSHLNPAPASIVVDIEETGSGLDLNTTIFQVVDDSFNEITGNIDFASGLLSFTPHATFNESLFVITLQLYDDMDNHTGTYTYYFTVDTTAPVLTIDSVTSPTNNPSQIITGTKEAYASVLLDEVEIVGSNIYTTWEYTAGLADGSNQFNFSSEDRAGNRSGTVITFIEYDETAPLPVNELTIDADGTGTSMLLDWTGYDEASQSDIDYYDVYRSEALFTDVSAMTAVDTVAAGGSRTYSAGGLTRGTRYYFAVVAVDILGNANPSVSTVNAIPIDTVPPEDVADVGIESYANALDLSWTASIDSHGDLVGYRIYGNGNEYTTTGTTFTLDNLTPATSYPITIKAYDNDTNESPGIAVTGVTLLPNPGNLTAQAHHGYIDLYWDPVEPGASVQHYLVYYQDENAGDFSSVQTMTPALTIDANTTTARIQGLTNGMTYYLAVTAVNLSGGEEKSVATITAVPEEDISGPVLSNIEESGSPLISGLLLLRNAVFSLAIEDDTAVDRIEFTLIDVGGGQVALQYIDSNGTNGYAWAMGITGLTDGEYLLRFTAYDVLENSTVTEFNLEINQPPPFSCFSDCIE